MSGRRGARPRHVCQGCGKLAAWRPGAVCSSCKVDGMLARVRAGEQAARPPAVPVVDVAALQRVHERWLARQSLDHPWRVAREKGAA